MMRAGPKGPPVPKKHAFLFFFSLQAGVILYVATIFVVRVTALLYNVTATNRYASGVPLAFSFIVLLLFTVGNVVSLIFVSTGAFLFQTRLTKFGNFFLLTTECIWLVMSILGFIPQIYLYQYVCVDDRCPSTQWIFNEGYRWDIHDCPKTVTRNPSDAVAGRQLESEEGHKEEQRKQDASPTSNLTTPVIANPSGLSNEMNYSTTPTTAKSTGTDSTADLTLSEDTNITNYHFFIPHPTNDTNNTTSALTNAAENTTEGSTTMKLPPGVVMTPPCQTIPAIHGGRALELELESTPLISSSAVLKLLKNPLFNLSEEFPENKPDSSVSRSGARRTSFILSTLPTKQYVKKLWSETREGREKDVTVSQLAVHTTVQEPDSEPSRPSEKNHRLVEPAVDVDWSPSGVWRASFPGPTQHSQLWSEAPTLLNHSKIAGSVSNPEEDIVQLNLNQTDVPTKTEVEKMSGFPQTFPIPGGDAVVNTESANGLLPTDGSRIPSASPGNSSFGSAVLNTNLTQQGKPSTSATNPGHHIVRATPRIPFTTPILVLDHTNPGPGATNPGHHIVRISHKSNATTRPPLQGLPKFVYTDIPYFICYLYPSACRTEPPPRKRHLDGSEQSQETHTSDSEAEEAPTSPSKLTLSKIAFRKRPSVRQRNLQSMNLVNSLFQGRQNLGASSRIVNFKEEHFADECRHYQFNFLWALTLMCVWIGFTIYGQYTIFMFERYYLRIEGE